MELEISAEMRQQEFSEFIRAGVGLWRVMKPVLKLQNAETTFAFLY